MSLQKPCTNPSMYHVRQAVIAARKSDHKQRVGAVFAVGSRIISAGSNSYKTHPRSNSPYKTIHAEFSAFLRARTELSGATLYVVRLLATGDLGMAKPCPDCQRFIAKMNLKKIIYSTDHGFAEQLFPR